MKLYFVRHGESEANLLRELSNRGQRHPLTPRGREQARALADSLRAAGPFAQVYTSPLLRAAETAALLAAAVQAPVTACPISVGVADALREFDCGVLEGRADAEAWAAHDGLVVAWLAGRHAERIEGGESFDDLRARFVPFVARLLADPPASGDLILVSHGGLLRLMLPLVLANVSPAFAPRRIRPHPLRNAVAVEAETRGAELWCTRWPDAPLPPTP